MVITREKRSVKEERKIIGKEDEEVQIKKAQTATYRMGKWYGNEKIRAKA